MSDCLQLAQQLIAIASVSPDDKGCQQIIAKRLGACGFQNETLQYNDVTNLWSVKGGDGPLVVFAGHTDVVPAGDKEQWQSDPFTPTIREGYLYGRGSADMKTAVAAMVVASEQFVAEHPEHRGSIGFLITSAEELYTPDGTKAVMGELQNRKVQIDHCIVGEASSLEQLGDEIKVGRRGSLTGHLTIHGVQGHVAYGHLACNPIHQAALAIHELSHHKWDEGSEHFAPTSFQVSNIHGGTGADNVIPGELEVCFNFRFSEASTAEDLQGQVRAILDKHGLDYQISWIHSGTPFLSRQGELIVATKSVIKEQLGLDVRLSTAGGTSDARFIAPTGIETVELGFVNKTIHKINECILVEDIDKLVALYKGILTEILIG